MIKDAKNKMSLGSANSLIKMLYKPYSYVRLVQI